MYCLLSIVLFAGPYSIEWSAIPSGGIVAVECAGDVNDDGTEDIFAASGEAYGYGIICLDGISGEILWLNDSIPGAYKTGCLRTIGDADFDGIADLAVGTGLEYAVTAISGATGDILWSSSQNNAVQFVQRSIGPEPGDAVVLVSKVYGGENCTFFALDGQTGNALWSAPTQSTTDSWIRVTEGDATGNGWSEMGYSIDRASVMNGYVTVRDGHTGVVVGGSGAMYFPSMDICDSPMPCLAVSNFGDDPVMWVNSLIVGNTIWSSNDGSLFFPHLDFIPNITGPSTPYPEILGWSGSYLTLIRGDDGYFQDRYEFPGSLKSFDCYLDESQWRLAAITSTSFYCPYLTFVSPTLEPSVVLPSSGGADMCLLKSNLYPTPLIAVAMTGSGSGVCMINTSWPVGISGETSSSVPIVPVVNLLSVPGIGHIDIVGGSQAEIGILDITGRMIKRISINSGEQISVSLIPGVYLLVDQNSGLLLHKATVVSE